MIMIMVLDGISIGGVFEAKLDSLIVNDNSTNWF